MDSGETVTQQPVSTFPDTVCNVPNSRDGPAIREAASPVAFRVKPAAAPALQEQEQEHEISMRGTPTAVQCQEVTDRIDDIRESTETLDGIVAVEKIVDTSIIPVGKSVDAVVVQQSKETVDIEVEITEPADPENRSIEPPVLVASNMPQVEGHVELLIVQAGGKSDAEGIAVEVVLNEASPPVSGVELLPLGEDRGGPREVPTSIELVMEPPDVGIVGNVAENGNQQTSNVDCIVEIESAFLGGAHTSVSSTTVSLVDDDQGVGESGTKPKESKGLDAGSISELEQKIVDEVVISVNTAGDVAETAERNSAPALSYEEETSIGEPQFTNNLEEVAHKLAGNIVAFGNADASSGMGTVEEVVPPVEASDSALNATDPSTAGVSDINAQMVESLQVDHHVHISATGEDTLTAENTLNASDSSAANLMEGSTEMTTLVAESSENIKADDLVDTVTAQPILNGKEFDGDVLLNPEDVGDASVEEGKIVAEMEGIVGSEESTEVEVLAELFVVPAPAEPGNTLNADDSLTSIEMDISAEQSSIFVHLNASSDVITSETLEAAVLSNAIEEVKPTKEGAIPSSDDLVAPVDDGEDVALAIGDKESTDERIVFESALNDSSDIAMPNIVDASAEGEQVVLEELGTISRSTSALTTNELKEEKFRTGVDDTEEDLPFVDEAGLISETPKAIGPEEGEKLLVSEKFKVNEIQETLPETAVEVQIVNATLMLDQENAGMESAEKTENQAIMFQETMTIAKMDPGVHSDDAHNNAVNVVDKTTMAEKEDIEMANVVPKEREGNNANVTKFTVPQEFAAKDDLINVEEVLVAVETIDTTTVAISTGHGNGEAAAEDVDGPGGLIGVGSSVESSGLTITEIVVEESRAEQRSLWAISEPLVTPPEEEIIEAIGDLRTTVDDDIVDREELPKSMEGSVQEVATADDVGSELNDLQTDVDELPRSSESTGLQDQHVPHKDRVLDDLEQPEGNHNDTVVGMVSAAETGEEVKPLDLVDAHSPLVTATKVETGAAVGITVCPPVSTLVSSGENLQPTDVGAEIAVGSAVAGHKDNIVTIAEADKDTYSIPSEVSLEARDVMVVVDGNSVPALESGSVSISVTSYDADKLSSIDDSAVDDTQETIVEDNSNAAKGGAAHVLVASSTNELGLGLEAALDSSSALISEAKSMVLAEAAGVTPVVEMEMDGQVMDKGIESALDVSTDILDGLPVGEALDRNEKKRAREEEVAVAEDKEKTTKTAKTSNGEISALNDAGADGVKIDAMIAEDVQVDKKRSRDDLESGGAEPDTSIQTKALKAGIVDDDASPLCCKADTEEEADDAEECVEMEDEEEVQVKIVNGAGLESTFPRYKKRKIALFLGYSGAGYQGMQKNPGAITIEGELEEALFRAGAIAESNYGQPQKLDWRRAARTDKGVSAVGQVVSGCFFIDPPGFIERVNSHLPKQIRVYGYKRATAGFNAKKLCDRRKYEYVLPVYAFDPSVHLDRETAQALAAAEKVESVTETDIKTAFTQISGPAGERDASVVTDSEKSEGAIADENGALSVADAGLKTADLIAETVGISIKAASNDVSPKIEGKEDNQIPSSTISAITEEATAVTEVAHDDIAAGVPLQTQEVLVETKEVTKIVIDVSSEAKEILDEGASTAPVEVLVETEEVLTERKEATETVTDLSIEEKREALDEKVKKSTYKFGEAEFNRLNRILAGFEGHHNFHNFTVRTKATDPSANRYILSFGVEKTFTMDGIEFVRCSVVGQSFMLHQIRKMIGLAVAIMRGKAPESILATALRRDTKINVPLAPELGLFLEECYYSAYNLRFHATHEEMSLNSFAAEADEFKNEFIYPHIVSTEARDSTFAMWLHSLNDRHYPDFVTAREAEKLVNSEGG